MKQYRLAKNVTAWIVFLLASTIYCLTIEPTASFWDCPEFITSAYKLEVGHPPGAPFFMLTANFFTQFVSDPSQVAMMVNLMSALMSGACILFLYLSITHLVKRLFYTENKELTTSQIITIIGSGVAGALAYTFSDTFWFSAVEAEVYAYSSLFTAVVFWLILKWEEVADQPHADRWLILIAYLTGLSIGVHLLNLLCLPAIVLVYYYKKNPEANIKGSLLALFGSAVLVAIVLYGIIPGVIKVGGSFEILFVNHLGLPFNTGVIFYILVLALAIVWGVYETYQEKSELRMGLSFLFTVILLGIPFYGHGTTSLLIGAAVIALLSLYLFSDKIKQSYRVSSRTLNTTLLCIMFIMIGYSSYTLIVLRSIANPPMDQNSPEDIFTLGEYLGREQYGTRPLFYGQAFSSRVALEAKDGYCEPKKNLQTTKFIRKEKENPTEKDSYIEIPGRVEYQYAQNMIFPRMYSSAHADYYKQWVNIKGKEVPYDECGRTVMVNVPTQWENIKFFFTYQLNFMYWRYFMWNFVGRQNDIQGSGEIEHGNWITGFNFIDKYLVGNQELLPKELKENKGRNVYYGLPLLLGLIGLFWQIGKNKRGIQQFWVVFFLFFMTGIAIVLYLNQTPMQPRERDYAYAGSFYAFAIWIGMGVAGIADFLNNYIRNNKTLTAVIASIVGICVPLQMASQTWDDHDRSNRYVARDFGQNYLMTLPETNHPIIFTNGDNDTFPLWYNQDTEGVRTDARTCNLSYLQTDWYIDQMKRPAYESPSLPIHWERADYIEGTNEVIPIRPEVGKQLSKIYDNAKKELKEGKTDLYEKLVDEFGEEPFELKNIMERWVLTKNEELKVIPTDSIILTIDKEAVRRSDIRIPAALGDSIPDHMVISLKGKNYLQKSELMMLELIANTNWERPLYMAITVGPDYQLNMRDHFVQEGLAYRFTPFNVAKLNATIDTERLYDNLMNKYKFGGINNPGVYLDENTLRMCDTHRRLFSQLVSALLQEGKREKALKALAYCEENIPHENVPYDFQNGALHMGEAYLVLGETEKAESIISYLADKSVEYVTWYLSLEDYHLYPSLSEVEYHLAYLDAEVKILKRYNSSLTELYENKLEQLYNELVLRVGNKR